MPDRMWYYSSRGQQRGPVKTVQLKELAIAGDLRPDDLVWSDGMANWAAASTVKGLFAETSTAVREPAEPTTPDAAPKATAPSGESTSAAYAQQFSAATQLAGAASREAAGAFKTLLADPIGGLGPCFSRLGNKRALQVGVVFIVVAVLLYSLDVLMTFGGLGGGAAAKAKIFLQSFLSGTAAVAAMIGVSYAFRMATTRAVSFHADVFVVGASSLPIALASFLHSLVNLTNVIGAIVAIVIMIFGGVFSILILFKGETEIEQLSERMGAIATATVAAAGGAAASLVGRLLS
jgi:uncharacterized protein DUF4339